MDARRLEGTHRLGAADYLEAALRRRGARREGRDPRRVRPRDDLLANQGRHESKGELGACRSKQRFLKFERNDVDARGIVWP